MLHNESMMKSDEHVQPYWTNMNQHEPTIKGNVADLRGIPRLDDNVTTHQAMTHLQGQGSFIQAEWSIRHPQIHWRSANIGHRYPPKARASPRGAGPCAGRRPVSRLRLGGSLHFAARTLKCRSLHPCLFWDTLGDLTSENPCESRKNRWNC